jgi:hypothetical protein
MKVNRNKKAPAVAGASSKIKNRMPNITKTYGTNVLKFVD